MRQITLLDTTLRDGAQSEGVSYTLSDKRRIAESLDALGVDIIEGGNPLSNPKDLEFFARPPKLERARLAAFGSTMRRDDEELRLAAIDADMYVIYGKSSVSHVENVLRVSKQDNLRMIERSCREASLKRETHFDAEHFFDGYAIDPDYAIETLKAAARGGASVCVLCDTNGGVMPWEVERIAREVAKLGVPFGIHAHNDSGMAAAVSLAAVNAGASVVHGTIAGIGERCGNTDLCTIAPALKLRMGHGVNADLTKLTRTAIFVADVANVKLSGRTPYVGASAFAHKAGAHVDALYKHAGSFEHISPAQVGNERRTLISEHSGRTALINKLGDILPGISRTDERIVALTQKLKEQESLGYAYEGAEGSFRLLALRALGLAEPHFTPLDFNVYITKPWKKGRTQALIKIKVRDVEEITAAEGDGPVNALDAALRKSLAVFYPELNATRLIDFKVRVIEAAGTASMVRVSIESTDGVSEWSTVGVSRNIIEACWIALTDAIEYKLSGIG